MILILVDGSGDGERSSDAVDRPSTSDATTPGTATSTSTSTTTSTLRPEPISLAFTGDLMLGSDFPPTRIPPDDGSGTFAPVMGLLQADLLVGNLEGTVSTATTPKCAQGVPNCFVFRMPLHYAGYFADAGFDVLNVANNHHYDLGDEGAAETDRVVADAGMVTYGQAGTATRVDVGGSTVSFVGFYTFDTANNLLDVDAAAALVAAEQEAADLVVVTFHGGNEGSGAAHTPHEMEYFDGEPRGNLPEFAHAMVDAGADIVVGHGPHILRGMEFYGGALIGSPRLSGE